IEGTDVAFLAVGTMVEHARKVIEELSASGLSAGLVNCRFVKPIDRAMLSDLAGRYGVLITLEENTLRGGFGTGIYEEMRGLGAAARLHHVGLPDQFILHGGRGELFAEVGLSVDQIARTALDLLRKPAHA